MADVKQKESFGTVTIDRFGPELNGAPAAINVFLSFEEALKLHIGLLQVLSRLNSYNRSTKEGRKTAVNLCIFPGKLQLTINEGKLKEQ
jgi:hypothetical protein